MNSYWKKILIMASILVVFIFACLLFETKPIIESYNTHKKQYSDKQNDLLSLFDKLDALQKIEKNSDLFEAKSDEVKTLWPETAEVSKFMIQTEDLAKQKNIVLQNFSIQEKKLAKKVSSSQTEEQSSDSSSDSTAKKEKSTTITQFSFNTTAPFPVALDLIRSMETFPRFNSISLISISADDDSSVDLNLTGRLYYGK